MITLAVILPVNLSILVFVLFIQVWYFQFDMDKDGLQAKRYLWEPLNHIVTQEPGDSSLVPSWITLVLMEDGTIYYPEETLVRAMLKDWSTSNEEERVDSFLSLASAALAVESDMSLARFRYRGQWGVCYYVEERFPGHVKVLGSRRYLINLFIVTTLLFQLGGIIMYNLRRNMSDLIRATERLRNKDFTTPLHVKGNNELSRVFDAFEELRKELNRTSSQATLMLLSITHDLKTPLTSIRGYLEAFQDGVIDESDDISEIVGTMLNKTSLLDNRISELLDYGRIFSEDEEVRKKSFNSSIWSSELDSYCFEEARLYKRKYESRIELPDDIEQQGDETRLTRAVTNLFDNALRYTSEGDLLRFSCSLSEGRKSLLIAVDDSGPGVSEEDRESVFDLFFRKDRTRNSRGMGIGLASVKFIVEFHGGSVRCMDSELGGARFEILLPLHPS